MSIMAKQGVCLYCGHDHGNPNKPMIPSVFKELSDTKQKLTDTQRLLAESQARERVKNDALRIADKFIDRHSESWYLSGQEDLATVRAATAIPSDSTALDAAIAKAKLEILLEAATAADEDGRGNLTGYQLRRMADELKGGK